MRWVIIGQDTTYFGACLKDRSLIGFKPVTITIADNPDLFRHHTQIDAIAKNIVIEDQLSRNGAKVIKNSIKIYAPDGSDITRQCTITAGENKYVIETGKNLSYDESIKVSYQVKLKEASLSGKTLKNTATGKADFVKPARAVRLVKIKKESKSTVTTGNKADRSNTSEYKRTPGTRDAASTPKTGDSFDEKWIFALLAASLGGSFIYWKKKKKH